MTTGISSLDHVNILTDDIGRMSRFYADVLGLSHLRAHQVGYQVNIVPDLGLRSVNVYDPEGNHIEVVFEPAEEADISPYQPVRAE